MRNKNNGHRTGQRYLRDRRLSLQAKGLMAIILNEPRKSLDVDEIMKISGEDEDTVFDCLVCLWRLGYLAVRDLHLGCFGHWVLAINPNKTSTKGDSR